VPFYLQPVLGGNDDLRGYQRYRFYDDNSFIGTIEHRWHSFAGMDVAAFVDLGKVAADADLLYRTNLRASFGIGFRFRVRNKVIMRIDQAYGNEGYRFMWTFSDIFTAKRQ
jgi:hemolysin activation/secretion protein